MTAVCYDSYPAYVPAAGTISIEKEVLVPNEFGGQYVVRKRYCTPREIYSQIHQLLSVRVCSKCGHEAPECREQWYEPCPQCTAGSDDRACLIDEYDTIPCIYGAPDTEIAPRNWDHEIMVYCCTGGNEGYNLFVSIYLTNHRRDESSMVHVYRLKSFLGMEHVHNLSKRVMQAIGVWQ